MKYMITVRAEHYSTHYRASVNKYSRPAKAKNYGSVRNTELSPTCFRGELKTFYFRGAYLRDQARS